MSYQPSSLPKVSEKPSLRGGRMSSRPALEMVPHRRFDQPQLILVTGKRGSGKTWFIQNWIQSREPRLLVLDPFDKDFAGIRRRVEYETALVEFRASADQGADAERYYPLRRRIVPDWGAIDPTAKYQSNCRDYAEAFFDALVAACPPGHPPLNVRLVLDEISLYVGKVVRGTSFETLVLQGRRMGISLVCATQRTNRFPVEIRSEVTDFIAFNASLRIDKEVYEDFGWENADEEAPTLKRGECYYIDEGMPDE